MNISRDRLAALMKTDRFPRSATYDPEWVARNQMGPNVLWLTEWLCEKLPLERGQRVLDMGCGKACSSIFLAKEYGVQVWATDLWIPASENARRINEAGVGDRVFPIYAEAHALPYADDFFDAAVSLDSYQYYGTSDVYLNYFTKFVKPGGRIGIAGPALTREIEDEAPAHLARKQASGGIFWDPRECFSLHSAAWWQRHWGRTGLVEIETADELEDGWKYWLQHDRAITEAGLNIFPSDAEVLEADAGRYLGFARLVAKKT